MAILDFHTVVLQVQSVLKTFFVWRSSAPVHGDRNLQVPKRPFWCLNGFRCLSAFVLWNSFAEFFRFSFSYFLKLIFLQKGKPPFLQEINDLSPIIPALKSLLATEEE